MQRKCSWCAEEGLAAKTAKLKTPKVFEIKTGGWKYLVTNTHRCEECKCYYGVAERINKNA